MKKAIGLANSEHEATLAVERLIEAGFDTQSVTILRSVDAFWQALGCTPAKIVATDFIIGASLGVACYALMGVLVAVGEVAIGLNNQVATSALLLFGFLGVLVGGLLGLLFGVSELEDEGRAVVHGFRRGNPLVMVSTADEHAMRAQRLLREANLRAVKICMAEGPKHRELGQTYWATDQRSNRIRWTARGLSVALTLVLLGFFMVGSMAPGNLANADLTNLVSDFLVLSWLMTQISIVVAWRWEGIGAILIAGSVLLFTGIDVIQKGIWQFSVLAPLAIVVAALFAWDWWRSQQTHLDTRAV